MMIKALNGLTPVYIRDILTLYEPSRSHCSSGQNILPLPKSNQIYRHRSFYIARSTLWNSLPLEMTIMTKLLDSKDS